MIETVEIKRVIRRMRGKSQAHLVEGADGNFYIAKFANNPKGNRTLINEWIGNFIYQACKISVPQMRLLQLKDSVLAASEDLIFVYPGRRLPIQSGFHLGSMCPVDPLANAIFDFLPRKMFPTVLNQQDFTKASLLDIFLRQNAHRQALFVRDGPKGGKRPFRAYMVDHTEIFSGNEWLLMDDAFQNFDASNLPADLHISYFDVLVNLINIEENILHTLVSELPDEWFAPNDHQELAALFQRLMLRKGWAQSLLSGIDNKIDLFSKSRQPDARSQRPHFNGWQCQRPASPRS